MRESTPPGLARVAGWIWRCAAAETIGMTAAALAAHGADTLPRDRVGVTAALGLIVLGGLVEALAIGQAQELGLRRAGLMVQRRLFLGVTALVAGLGWAAASAPATLSSDVDGTTPPIGLILLGAAVLGVSLGAVLGSAQATALPEQRRRWIGASALGWGVAMPIIFAGATAPDTSWPLATVLPLAAGTGALAGAALGAVLAGTVRGRTV